ncbi:MAG: hypothetical protein COB15_01985 [Flavobacteriales bacterium]|nr:MAG: hypothetical protein COB15_01985 [Flavobacteriales bacterium]
MKLYYSLLINLLIIFSISAQPALLPTIGVGNLPSDSDPICTIPMVGGSSSNIFVGDTIPHFKLYDINGVQMDIGSTLQQGKAVLIMCGSFTCPAFRNKVDELATIAAMYPTQLEVMMIYVVEAHPKTPDLCPYSGLVNEANNVGTSASFLQPTTYLERKNAVQEFLDSMTVEISGIPVYIDGPCNEWWHAFGEAPNDGFLINPDGVVEIEQVWFDKFPDDMFADVATYIAANPNLGTTEYFQQKINIFPNPVASGKNITLSIPKEMGNYTIDLIDITGKTIMTLNNTASLRLDEKLFQQGVYFMKITADNGKTYTKKLIIN